MSLSPYRAPGGKVWQVSLKPRGKFEGPVNVGPEDLVFECGGERRVLRDYGLGHSKPIGKMTNEELGELFGEAVRV